MRLDDYRESDNVEQQRGGGSGFGGGGGGGLGLIFSLIASRFGIGGIVILVIGMMIFGMNPLSLIGGGTTSPQQAQTSGQSPKQVCDADAAHQFSCRVLASTEDTWAAIFRQGGKQYQPTTLSFYDRSGQSGCGAAQSAMGPFYCPTDRKVYLDPEFFDELTTRFQAAGDFAQAYVIAHEVGHHIQDLLGTLGQVHDQQQAAGKAQGNALQVRIELQADCYAGVWAANAKDARGQSVMEPGDVEEGLRAANAIGDDTLQKSAGQTPMPDSFTHGTSAERVAWLKRGLESGDPAKCNTFAGAIG